MFTIITASDFLKKAEQDLSALMEDQQDAGKAINSILSLHHVYEWVWNRHFDAMAPADIRGTFITKKEPRGAPTGDSFKEWLKDNSPHFDLIRRLANGTKHCLKMNTDLLPMELKGFGKGLYGVGPYGTSYLVIYMGDELQASERYLLPHKVLTTQMDFWKEFYKEFAIP